MTETFITKIHIRNSRNISNLTIPLSENERKHLIITGKNGSGKTSLLRDLAQFFQFIDNRGYLNFIQNIEQLNKVKKELDVAVKLNPTLKVQLENSFNTYLKGIEKFGGVEIYFKNYNIIQDQLRAGQFLFTFFDAKRHANFNVPEGINKINLNKKYRSGENANINFIQYIVNLKADRSFAKDDGEMAVVKRIDDWFDRFEDRLREIFDSPNLILKFDRKTYNFEIIDGNKLPFTFNTMSDGYSAIISMVAELILRMEAHELKSYDLQGVVLIDEIETHLHVELQKRILPFLTDFFPKIQFVVTTHSPFILSSVSNAVICDLETSLVTEDLSGYSYDALIESYFNVDKYSNEVKCKVLRFEELYSKEALSEEEAIELRHLRNYFVHIPKYLSKELMVKLQQIELKNLGKKHN